jgi:cohesin complex subunit SA-1/2
MKALPRLFAKHQADEKRIAVVLILPRLMSLDLYLEMRMVTVRVENDNDIVFLIFRDSHTPVCGMMS